jgi:hypothetical protein
MFLGGWMDGWMDGWVEVKAVLRIAYSNQKKTSVFCIVCNCNKERNIPLS